MRRQPMEDTHSQANGRARPSTSAASGTRKPKSGAAGSPAKRSGRGKAPSLEEQLRSLLRALSAVRHGDFSARLAFELSPGYPANTAASGHAGAQLGAGADQATVQ